MREIKLLFLRLLHWMNYQTDTVHWFAERQYPGSVTANGGIYQRRDGCCNWDTSTSVFDYRTLDNMEKGFQGKFSSRMHNGDEHPAEIYYSNGRELDLITNTVSSRGGLTERAVSAMNMPTNLLSDLKLPTIEAVVASANKRCGCFKFKPHV